MIKAAIFDFYGVIQTDEVTIWAEKQALEHPGIYDVVDEVSKQIDVDQITLDQYFAGLAEAVGRHVDVVKAELKSEVTINSPLLRVVDELRERGIKTAILSNDGSSLRAYLEEHDIVKHFDEIFISGELNMMKPDVRIYQYAITELGISASEAIFFDDRQSNVDGALAVGLQAERYASASEVRKLLS